MKPVFTFLGGAVAGIIGLLAFQEPRTVFIQQHPTSSESGAPSSASDLRRSADWTSRRFYYGQPLFITDRSGTEYLLLCTGVPGSPVDYRWEVTPDRSRGGRGRLFEKYEKVQEAPGKFRLWDEGSELWIQIEGLRLQWSIGGPDCGWICFDPDQVTVSDESPR